MKMGDSINMSGSTKNLELPIVVSSKKTSKHHTILSVKRNLQNALKPLVPLKNGRVVGRSSHQIVYFVLKVVALELVRRLSSARCPIIWKSLQALQIVCYPPFKWIQKWTPFKLLVEGMQKLSRPLLFLSIATAISEKADVSEGNPDSSDESHLSQPEAPPQLSPESETTFEAVDPVASENWLLRLKEELELLGITLPERINDDELERFYNAANGDYSCLLPSIKKTIRWRETYKILSLQELEMWSNLVFWHGCDVKLRPCLIVRLGLACSSLAYDERPRFAQAVVSHVEYGVMHLANPEDPRVTVLMDCEGVSAFKFPMQMMRSCSTLVQDHFPNRLAVMFIVRLPPVVRVVAQTLMQVLRPSTRQKLRVVKESGEKVLLEYLQTVPSFLGGHCSCAQCHTLSVGNIRPLTLETDKGGPDMILRSELEDSYLIDASFPGSCDQILRTTIIGILMLWIFIALIVSVQSR